QKQMRKAAQQAKQQAAPQQRAAAAELRAKQEERRQPPIASSHRFKPKDCPALALDALDTAAKVMHYLAKRSAVGAAAAQGMEAAPANSSSGSTADINVASHSSSGGGEFVGGSSRVSGDNNGMGASSSSTSSSSGTSSSTSRNAGGFGVVAVLPEEWWRDALAALDVVVEERGCLDVACSTAGLGALLQQATMRDSGGRFGHHRGVLLSDNVAANLGIAQPLGLTPCLERVLRRLLPQLPGSVERLDMPGVFAFLVDDTSLRSLLLTADAVHLVPYVVSSSKAVSRLVAKEVVPSNNKNVVYEAVDAMGLYCVPVELLLVMQLCGKVLAAKEGAQGGAAAQAEPSGTVGERSAAKDAAASGAAVAPGAAVGMGECGSGGGADVAGGGDGGGDNSDCSGELPSVSEVSAEAAERVLLIGSLMAARRLPAVAAALPLLTSYGTRMLVFRTQQVVAHVLLRWVPLLATAYLLASKQRQAAAAAAWKQLLLADMDVFGLMDLAMSAAAEVAPFAAPKLHAALLYPPALSHLLAAFLAMLLAFPTEVAAAMAPNYAEMMPETAAGGNGTTGSRKQQRLPVPSLISALRHYAVLYGEGSCMSEFGTVRMLLGDLGE
ncbi:hypothetical protein Agub_g8950, partial [Astrephomene gubernaculifera]